MLEELTLGRTALFNHVDMGLIDVQIEKKTPLLNFYSGILKKVHLKEVRSHQSALIAANLLREKRTVTVFIKPSDLVKYK